jgi:hypothetical protein
MCPLRTCRVTATGLDGVSHSIEVQASSLYEAAASAVAAFRQEGWAEGALTPNARLRVEVQLPATVHEVPLKAVEQWLRSPNAGPRDYATKRKFAGKPPR